MEKRNLFIVLIGFPIIYIIYSLTPFSSELFVNKNNDYFFLFWSGIIIIHWMSFFTVKHFLKKENSTFFDIGYKLSKKGTTILIVSFFSLAFLVFGFTEWSLNYVEIDEEKLKGLPMFFPKTSYQRLFFIFSVFSAGFIEEIIYRGYAITKLNKIGLNKWIALIPAGISFVFIHGIIGFSQFWFYFIPALIFGVIYILSKRLLPSIILHLLFDLTAIMAVFQAISK